MLKDLFAIKEASGPDLTQLPEDLINSIKKNIREGAKDLQQKWANALELVHKAYDVEGVQRPDPTMDAAWKQYEENLAYAVQQLAKHRGMDDDWRMSSSMFREALIPTHKFRIEFTDGSGSDETYIEAQNIDQVVERVQKHAECDLIFETVARDRVNLKFAKWGIQKNTKVHITRVD